MAAPVTDDERARIVEAIKAGTPRNEIARDFDRSAGTITAIAKAEGLTFDRSATKTACEARMADLAAERARLAEELMRDAHRLRRQLWEPCIEKKAMQLGGGMHEPRTVEIVTIEHDQPPFVDQQRILTSVAIAVDKVLAIDRHDNRAEDGLAAVDQWLRGLVGDEAAA